MINEFFTWLMSLHNHSWLVFNTPGDKIRAALWCIINISTAFSYFAIPWEIYQWKKAFPFRAPSIIAVSFIGFIFFCGAHHIVDVIIMPSAPWWAILSVNVAMAVCSVVTAVYLRLKRHDIQHGLAIFAETLKALDVVEEKQWR